MLKKFWGCVREFKTQTFITLFFIVLEAVIEALIPFITASMINKIEAGAVMSDILKTGGTLAVMAVLSLCCGGIAGFSSAKASAGFARNLRHDMFEKIQSFSFSNIDKFSSASLVTRMTTDIENVRISYMMLIRIAVRAPMLLIFSIIMAYIMGGVMATSFIVLIPVLAVGLFLISRKAMPAFRAVFR
ncbi:MAG: ABC transporter ATP-binding protein, partial [Firmicutes bacterium]|nr:ABC transporter ATP-binding protein [Candidatus Colimorpha enterica]